MHRCFSDFFFAPRTPLPPHPPPTPTKQTNKKHGTHAHTRMHARTYTERHAHTYIDRQRHTVVTCSTCPRARGSALWRCAEWWRHPAAQWRGRSGPPPGSRTQHCPAPPSQSPGASPRCTSWGAQRRAGQGAAHSTAVLTCTVDEANECWPTQGMRLMSADPHRGWGYWVLTYTGDEASECWPTQGMRLVSADLHRGWG